MVGLQAPVKVSPTIKFVRWSLLLWGIFYGSNKKTVLEALEKKQRILRLEAIEKRRKRQEEENKKSYKELLIFLGGMIGMEFPRNWKPPE